MESTGIVKRIDFKAYSKEVLQVVLFCAHCDPEGKGGNGGNIFSANYSFGSICEQAQNTKRFFCPTCGRKINYEHIIKEREFHPTY